MKRFDVVTEFGIYRNCYFVVSSYAVDGSLCLQVKNDEDGNICILTVYLGKVRKNMAYLDINNCDFAEKLVKDLDIGVFSRFRCESGFCVYPLYIFDIDKIKEYTKEGR